MAKVSNISLPASDLRTYSPEPKSRMGRFTEVLGGIGSAAARIATGGVSDLGTYQSLIDRQIQMQEEVQRVSIVSNTIKSEHEAKMAAIRNVRSA